MDFKISIENSTFHDHSAGVGTVNVGTASDKECDVLEQLRSIRIDLEKLEQLNASILSLEQAIREQNRPKAKMIVQQITSGFTSSLLANVISDIVKPFLG